MSSRLCLFSSFRSHDFAISILDFCVMTFHALYLTFLIVSSLLRLSVAIFIVVTCFCRPLTSSNTYSRIRCVNQQLVFAIISVLLRICFALPENGFEASCHSCPRKCWCSRDTGETCQAEAFASTHRKLERVIEDLVFPSVLKTAFESTLVSGRRAYVATSWRRGMLA